MLASITLYALWVFMTGFMLTVVVAGGRERRPRRLPKLRNESTRKTLPYA